MAQRSRMNPRSPGADWLGRRAQEAAIGAAGLALALTLILPFG